MHSSKDVLKTDVAANVVSFPVAILWGYIFLGLKGIPIEKNTYKDVIVDRSAGCIFHIETGH
jgi:hypothetical protein